MMRLEDLTKEQKEQLKVQFLDNLLMEKENRNISYGEIASINEIISDDDEDFINAYSMYSFVDEDFF